MTSRALTWSNCLNVRDLGGLPVAGGARTRHGALVRADNLAKLTAAGRGALFAFGVRTVVDLRDPREVASAPGPFAADPVVAYRNVPLISEANWAAVRERSRPPHEADVLTLELSAENIASVMRAIGAAPPGGVVFHCNAGMERTGLVAMLLLSLAGAHDADIADDYVTSANCLGPLFEEWRSKRDASGRASLNGWLERIADPAHVLETLRHLRGRGGAQEYLVASGLAAVDRDRLRARLV